MKNKICIVGPCINMGGIERASSTIANYFCEKGHNVLYLAIFKHPRFFKLLPKIEYDEPLDGSNIKRLNIFKTIVRIRKKLKHFDPDTILVFNKFYASLTLIALIGLKKKVYISERSSPLYKWQKKIEIINKLAFFLNPPTGVIAQTILAAKFQKKHYKKNTNIIVIPNALRMVKLYPKIKRKQIILAVGRLGDALKGFDRLIDAFSKIDNNDWQLVFAGGDEEGDELKKIAKEQGVLKKIIFLGKVKEIDKVYAEAGIFVIPSRSEGFPNALCEAMAAGLPCISFDFVAGPRDIINDGVNGIIVENSNIRTLAKAIDNLILNEEKRMFLGINAMNISKRLDKGIIGEEFLKFVLS